MHNVINIFSFFFVLSDVAMFYECPVCSRAFKQKRDMLRHVRIVHNKDKPYICNVCGKASSTSSNLKRHYLVHMNMQI